MEFFLNDINPWLVEISSLSFLVPLLAAVAFIFLRRSEFFWLVVIYIVFYSIGDALGYLTVFFGTDNNLWTFHVGSILEFSALSLLFYKSFGKPVFRKTVIVFTCVFLLFAIWNAIYGEGLLQMDTHTKIVANTLLITMILMYFYEVANDMKITYLDRNPMFLLCCFLLIAKAGSTMSFTMFKDSLAVSWDAAKMCLSVMYATALLYNLSLVLVLKRTPIQ